MTNAILAKGAEQLSGVQKPTTASPSALDKAVSSKRASSALTISDSAQVSDRAKLMSKLSQAEPAKAKAVLSSLAKGLHQAATSAGAKSVKGKQLNSAGEAFDRAVQRSQALSRKNQASAKADKVLAAKVVRAQEQASISDARVRAVSAAYQKASQLHNTAAVDQYIHQALQNLG